MIFPVKINEWFFDKNSGFYEDRGYLEEALPHLKCNVCGKKANKRGYVYHAIAYGYGTDDYWCSLKCLGTVNGKS